MNRRHFLNRMMAGAAAFGTSAAFHPVNAWAQAAPDAARPAANAAPRPLGVVSRTIEVNGKAARVFGLAQSDGTSGLTLDAGGSFDVALSNRIDEPTLIHWHGLTPPWAMDGVPDNPAALLGPSEARRYTFPVGAGGTHWMHAHTLQEQNLLAAPLIVRTAADRQRDEQEVVILLHDFSFTPAEELLAKLKGSPTAGAMPMDQGAMAQSDAMKGMAGMMDSGTTGQMQSMPGMVMDLNDIDYDAYLANDRTLGDPEVVAVDKGGRVRLRIINGATATAFTINIGSLDGELIAVDGQAVQPVAGGSFRSGLRTGLLSNSWGNDYPRDGWDEMFDVVVISGEVGMRKPEPEIFEHTLALLGLPAAACVFVDDLAPNVAAAVEVGMVGVQHTSYEATRLELEALFGRPLG